MSLLRKRWIVVLVGNESGLRTPLPFLRFRTRDMAAAWIDQHQWQATQLLRYEVESLS